MAETLLEVNNLKTYFFTRSGAVKAVDDVSFTIEQGQTLGVVGESGCGKSVTALSVMRLIASSLLARLWADRQQVVRQALVYGCLAYIEEPGRGD